MTDTQNAEPAPEITWPSDEQRLIWSNSLHHEADRVTDDSQPLRLVTAKVVQQDNEWADGPDGTPQHIAQKTVIELEWRRP